ncbi:alpha amylase C-terminal domain-containing protein, partial [bacterium]|nr:alpha amylase C-terminal domain-containing protein [bacterium]
ASTLGRINYTEYAKDKMQKMAKLTKKLNQIKAENKALTSGNYVYSNTIGDHIDVVATHMQDKTSNNEIFTVTNAANYSYPREDADCYYIKFPAGNWVEILNTDDGKFGGYGYVNDDIIESSGNENSPIKLGSYSTAIFKKIS